MKDINNKTHNKIHCNVEITPTATGAPGGANKSTTLIAIIFPAKNSMFQLHFRHTVQATGFFVFSMT